MGSTRRRWRRCRLCRQRALRRRRIPVPDREPADRFFVIRRGGVALDVVGPGTSARRRHGGPGRCRGGLLVGTPVPLADRRARRSRPAPWSSTDVPARPVRGRPTGGLRAAPASGQGDVRPALLSADPPARPVRAPSARCPEARRSRGAHAPPPVRGGRSATTRADTVTLVLPRRTARRSPSRPGSSRWSAAPLGEVPISISGDPAHPDRLLHTVREVGDVTTALPGAGRGDPVFVRGPYGTSWDVARRSRGGRRVRRWRHRVGAAAASRARGARQPRQVPSGGRALRQLVAPTTCSSADSMADGRDQGVEVR